MVEYIRKDTLTKVYMMKGKDKLRLSTVINELEMLPAADVAPMRHGRWVEFPRAHYFKCSECKHTVPYRKASLVNGFREYNFCPACGCKMILEDKA